MDPDNQENDRAKQDDFSVREVTEFLSLNYPEKINWKTCKYFLKAATEISQPLNVLESLIIIYEESLHGDTLSARQDAKDILKTFEQESARFLRRDFQGTIKTIAHLEKHFAKAIDMTMRRGKRGNYYTLNPR